MERIRSAGPVRRMAYCGQGNRGKNMKAVVLHQRTEAKDIVLSEVPIPQVRPGWVLVKIKAFGLNHSEQLLRLQEIDAPYINKPIIPGIECVGEVVDPSDSDLAIGQRVVACMGGMGRSFHGSYAQYALLPRRIVFTADTTLPWEALGAVPETYFTAWGSLFECLHLTQRIPFSSAEQHVRWAMLPCNLLRRLA